MNNKNAKEIQKIYRQTKEDFKYGRRFQESEKTEEEIRFDYLLDKED